MTTSPTATASTPAIAGRVATIFGNRVTIEVAGEQTDGRLAVVRYEMLPETVGPPLHSHPFDEVFRVEAGALTFRLGENTVRAEAGAVVRAPAGTPHTFGNPDPEPATVLIEIAPAGFERYFLELAEYVAAHGRPTPDAARTMGARYGVAFVDAPR